MRYYDPAEGAGVLAVDEAEVEGAGVFEVVEAAEEPFEPARPAVATPLVEAFCATEVDAAGGAASGDLT